MKNIKRVIALVFALVFCLSATVIASAETHTIDGSILEFKPLQGDVNIDGFLNLKDLVRYKKYVLEYDVTIDKEVMCYFDVKTDAFKFEKGTYQSAVGASSRDIKLREKIEL